MEDKKYSVFIIDDDKFLSSMYVSKFTKSGHTATVATSAIEALAKIKEGFVPDVILSDVVLPGMDGLEFLEKVRKENLVPQSAFIMLTNQSNSSEIERAKKLGVAGYIVKATLIPSEIVTEVVKIAQALGK